MSVIMFDKTRSLYVVELRWLKVNQHLFVNEGSAEQNKELSLGAAGPVERAARGQRRARKGIIRGAGRLRRRCGPLCEVLVSEKTIFGRPNSAGS